MVGGDTTAASANILESRRRICDGDNNTHGLLSEWWSAHATGLTSVCLHSCPTGLTAGGPEAVPDTIGLVAVWSGGIRPTLPVMQSHTKLNQRSWQASDRCNHPDQGTRRNRFARQRPTCRGLLAHRDDGERRCQNQTFVSGGSAKHTCPLPNGDCRAGGPQWAGRRVVRSTR